MPIGGNMTNYPMGFANGLQVRGMPLLQMQPGNVFWVNNCAQLNVGANGGSDGNRGTYLSPFATLQYALNQCVQGRGDIIFLGAGHTENIANATTLAMNSANTAIIGLGSGGSRPIITFTTATTANIPVRSGGMSLQNILFVNNFLDVASNFTAISASVTASIATTTLTVTVVGSGTLYPGTTLMGTGILPHTIIVSQLTGTTGGVGTYLINRSQTFASGTVTTGPHNFAIDNCEFRDLSSVLNALTCVTGSATTNAMNGFSFTRNLIISLGTTAATTAIKTTAAQDRVNISDNIGNWAVLNDTAAMLATGATSITNFMFNRNQIYRPNTSTTSGLAISTSATAWTGSCNDNRIWGLDNSAQIWINTGTKLGFNQNYCPITATADSSGSINPAIS
tara:strand:- start:1162 stop:2346 length:1185 start_codon:yes stop_codon:yes gene_type:complete